MYYPPYSPDNVRRYVQERGGEYSGAFVCGCCADSLPVVLDKELFPGKVVFLDIGGEGMTRLSEEEMENFQKRVDLYLRGSQLASELGPVLKELME
jgi:hypothetical protein